MILSKNQWIYKSQNIENFNLLYQVNDSSQPEGDSGRVADISLARKVVKWKPTTTLIDGLNLTYDYFSKLSLALCLPLTSKGCRSLSEIEKRLANLVLDISCHVFIGIDDDDPIYNLPDVNQSWFEEILSRPCYIRKFTKEESKVDDGKGRVVPYIYGMYNLLIKDAYAAGLEYAVLWGDDINSKDNNWGGKSQMQGETINRRLGGISQNECVVQISESSRFLTHC